jgi:hypothetical protein
METEGPLSSARRRLALATVLLAVGLASGPSAPAGDLDTNFRQPPESARPWVFWYWMNAAVSHEGITADLEAMRDAGLGGAYLMPIRGATDPPQWEPPVEQLTSEWWDAVLHALREADRLGLRIAMHASDGFALAGGPWITPELSMQRIVWSDTRVEGGGRLADPLPQPPTREGYHRDIAVFAFPSVEGSGQTTRTTVPVVTTSEGGDAPPARRPSGLERPRGSLDPPAGGPHLHRPPQRDGWRGTRRGGGRGGPGSTMRAACRRSCSGGARWPTSPCSRARRSPAGPSSPSA